MPLRPAFAWPPYVRRWIRISDGLAGRMGRVLGSASMNFSATDPARYAWEPVLPGDRDHMSRPRRLLHVVADRITWQHALDEARRRAAGHSPPDLSATGRAA